MIRRPGVALARVLIRTYQLLISPILGPACRFAPSCSEYALEAVTRHGLIKGCGLAVRRLLRCHPWGGGGFDPVP
ncbi:MAG: membrane protein insertion efficiency factor YidD [Desulfatitalea sp.]|nr:membrane protein insertion efficiency factor YidD [Desulfatitalea sp.]